VAATATVRGVRDSAAKIPVIEKKKGNQSEYSKQKNHSRNTYSP